MYLLSFGEPTPHPSRALREALDRARIPYLDVGPTCRERAAKGQRLFFEVDGYSNRDAYALIAEACSLTSWNTRSDTNFGTC